MCKHTIRLTVQFLSKFARRAGCSRAARTCVQMRKMAAWMDEQNSGEMDGSIPVLKPGDASMAAPFTIRAHDVGPATDIIKQGRCTLVITVQMFKILGLTCLATAFSLSVLSLDGVKLGDKQARCRFAYAACRHRMWLVSIAENGHHTGPLDKFLHRSEAGMCAASRACQRCWKAGCRALAGDICRRAASGAVLLRLQRQAARRAGARAAAPERLQPLRDGLTAGADGAADRPCGAHVASRQAAHA